MLICAGRDKRLRPSLSPAHGKGMRQTSQRNRRHCVVSLVPPPDRSVGGRGVMFQSCCFLHGGFTSHSPSLRARGIGSRATNEPHHVCFHAGGNARLNDSGRHGSIAAVGCFFSVSRIFTTAAATCVVNAASSPALCGPYK